MQPDASPPEPPPGPPSPPPATINTMIDRYLCWARDWYRTPPDPSGQRHCTREADNIGSSLKHLRRLAGDRPPTTLTADDLAALQQQMLAPRDPRDPRTTPRQLTRGYINKCVQRVQQMYTWAAKPPRRWVTSEQLTELALIDPLVYGRSSAREPLPVQPVPHSTYTAALDACAIDAMRCRPREAIAALRLGMMLEIHWGTGMRPGELVSMTTAELTIETAELPTMGRQSIMIYRPWRHKTRHHGFDRTIFIAPEPAGLIEQWRRRLGLAETDPQPLFAPTTTKAITTGDYRNRLAALCARHRLDPFTPNQIRHAFATRMRKLTGGLDVVQTLMGHQHMSTTEIYARPDAAAAIEAILRM